VSLFGNPDEYWLESTRSPNYLVSNFGRVYCVSARHMMKATLSHRTASGGRLRVSIRYYDPERGKVAANLYVGHEVLTLFGSRIEAEAHQNNPSMIVAYRDGDISNCHESNLYWVVRGTARYDDFLVRRQLFERGQREAARLVAAATPVAAVDSRPEPDEVEILAPVEHIRRPAPAVAAPTFLPPVGDTARRVGSRPGAMPTREAVRQAQAAMRSWGDLSADERLACKAWHVQRGGSNRGRVSRDVIMAWDAQGSPEPEGAAWRAS